MTYLVAKGIGTEVLEGDLEAAKLAAQGDLDGHGRIGPDGICGCHFGRRREVGRVTADAESSLDPMVGMAR
jgi:hypothetical protein